MTAHEATGMTGGRRVRDDLAALADGMASASKPGAGSKAAPRARRQFFFAASVASLACAALAPSLPAGRVASGWLAAMLAALGVAAWLARPLSGARQRRALGAWLIALSVVLAAVAFSHRASVGQAALVPYGVLVGVAVFGSGRRAGFAVAGLQVLLLLALHAAWWPGSGAATAGHLGPLALHLASVATGLVGALVVAQATAGFVQAAREREQRLRDLFQLNPVAIFVHRDGRTLDANPAALALFGCASLQELQGSKAWDCLETQTMRQLAELRNDAILTLPPGSALEPVAYRLLVDGRIVAVRATSISVQVDGAPAVLAMFTDETERLAAEDALRRSQALLSQLVESTPDAVTIAEVATGRLRMVNPAFERIYGWSAAEAVGRTSLELGMWWSPANRADFIAALRTSNHVSSRPAVVRSRDGRRLELAVSAARFEMDGQELMVSTARDLTDAERLRLEREAFLDNASLGIAVTRRHRFVVANRFFAAMLGRSTAELLGQSGRLAWPDDAAYDAATARWGPALARAEAVEFETTLVRHGGAAFLAHVRANVVDPLRPREGGTVWIVEDVTERRSAERALDQAHRAAEAASRAKSAFLANTSHELRTPLNGIVGLAALAGNPDVDAPTRQRYLDQIIDSARALAAIVSDVLDLSKIEAGQLRMELATFDLGQLLAGLHDTYAALAQARALVLRAEIDVGGAVLGDPLRLRQVVGNFLSNAVKFTLQGQIVLRAARLPSPADSCGADGRVRIEVQDSGVGIDAAARARLFRPFSQADDSTTRRFGGTGLGLSISRELAALMGGEVGVDSEPGQGSRFWVELPLPAASPGPEPKLPPPDAGSAVGMRVLLVEDNPVNMMVAAAMLEDWGVEVERAHDGAQALHALHEALARGRLPDGVLMDMQMPGMDGCEATRRLRTIDGLQQLPVFAFTASVLVEERDRALAAGMDEFLAKPVDPDRLRAMLLKMRGMGRGVGPA